VISSARRKLLVALSIGRIDDVVRCTFIPSGVEGLLESEAHGGHGTFPRNIRGRKRERRRDDREHVGVVILDGQHREDDLHVPLEPFGEKRTDGAVDDASREHGLVRGPPFAAHEARA